VNKECRKCHVKAVYWDTTNKILRCHACGRIIPAKESAK